jgi:hypothetical protein
MDRNYIGADAPDGIAGRPSPKMTPGGLTNLFEILGHLEFELTYRTFDQAKEKMRKSVPAALQGSTTRSAWRYFDLGKSNWSELDPILDKMISQAPEMNSFWQAYRARLKDAFEREFRVLVPIEMRFRHSDLKSLVQDYANDLQNRRERGELITFPQGQSIFRKDGETWTIFFAGKLIAKDDGPGPFYVHLLLGNPKQPFGVSKMRKAHTAYLDPASPLRGQADLDSHDDGDDDDDDDGDRRRRRRIEEDGLHRPSDDLGEVHGEEEEQAILTRLDELEKLIAQAQAPDQDGAKVQEYRNEIPRLNKKLGEARGLSGRRRKLSHAARKDRDQVCNAINRFLVDLSDAHLPLHQHLARYLQRRPICCYAPDPDVQWTL